VTGNRPGQPGQSGRFDTAASGRLPTTANDPKRSLDSDRHDLSGGSALGERGGSLTFQRKRQTRLCNLVSTMPRPDKQGRWQHDLGKSTTPPSERVA
jgi:hypothetical protein